MEFIDVKETVLRDMAKTIKAGPKEIKCKFCKTIIGGKLLNGKENSFIFGVSKNHIRIIHGIHKDVAFYTKEEMFCFCEGCSRQINKEIPEIFSSDDPSEPTMGGHFITTFMVITEGKHFQISRFQSSLAKFREIMEKLA